MKVVEKGTNRAAQVHLHALGVIHPLEEYGEWVDPQDNALCCFVPVEVGQKIKVEGNFRGTTQDIQYEASIDGVCRKAHTITSKTVQAHKSKKIGFDKFLFNTKDGIVESEIIVNPMPSDTKLEEGDGTSIGVIELRLSIIRRLGDEHALRDIPVYYECIDEGYTPEIPVVYPSIPPQFAMTFEKDVPALDKSKANAMQKKMQAKRPGKEAWAIFRFHYREKQSILEMELDLSFSAAEKKNGSAYTLEIEELPMLEVPPKPAKPGEGEGASTRQSSPAPSSATKSMQEDPAKAAMADMTAEVRSQREVSPLFEPETFIDNTSKPVPSIEQEHVYDNDFEATLNGMLNDSTIGNGSTKSSGVHAPTAAMLPPPIITSVKRTAELTPPMSPLEKRAKPSFPNHLLSTPAAQSRFNSPVTASLERRIMDARRRATHSTQAVAKIREKKANAEEGLKPYQQRLLEDAERMERLAMEAEAVRAEEEADVEAKEALLAEYRANGI